VNSSPQNVSAMTDISANIFSLLILILIIMLSAREQSSGPRTEVPQVVDLGNDIEGIERSPLSGEEMFDLLYDRREEARFTKIDLFNQKIDIISDGKTEHFSSVESAVPRLRQIASGPARASVGVYVFSHHYYRDVIDNLRALGWFWHEVSVPQALRNIHSDSGGQGWSAGFSELIARPSNRAQFRTELERLLQSSSTDVNVRKSWSGGVASGQLPERIIDNLMRWSRTALNAISILCGLVFVGWVEMRRDRNGQICRTRPVPTLHRLAMLARKGERDP
jgi:hypothetical protein